MLDVVVFTLDHVRYGVPAGHVVEVVRAVEVAPLPGLPAVVEGVIDYRGTLVPVFDTRRRFGHEPRAEQLDDHLLIVNGGRRLAALRADHADRLERIEPSAIEDPRDKIATVEQVTGVARLQDGLLLIHDPARFLDAAESEALEAALTKGPIRAPGHSRAEPEARP